MMKRMLLAVVLAAVSPAAFGQQVALGGWALPDGSVVSASGRFSWAATTGFVGGDTHISTPSSGSDSTRFTVLEAAAGRLVRAEKVRLYDQSTYDTVVDGELVDRNVHRSPLVGVAVVVQHDGSGWRVTGPESLDSRQTQALDEQSPIAPLDDPEYPARHVRVGEEWVVDDATLRAVYGPVEAGYPNRLTVRLDSLGTFENGPAAFITQDVEVSLLHDDGSRFIMDMSARIVRRLDLMLDVLTAWEGHARSEGPTAEGVVVTEGWMRRGDRLHVVSGRP